MTSRKNIFTLSTPIRHQNIFITPILLTTVLRCVITFKENPKIMLPDGGGVEGGWGNEGDGMI